MAVELHSFVSTEKAISDLQKIKVGDAVLTDEEIQGPLQVF